MWIPDPRFEMPELFETGKLPAQGFELNPDHPIAAKLDAAVFFTDGVAYDYISEKIITPTGASQTFSADQHGKHIDNTYTTAGWLNLGKILRNNSAATILTINRRTNTSALQNNSFGFANDVTVQRINTHWPWTDGNVYFDFGNFNNAWGRISYSEGQNTNYAAWCFRAGPQGLRIYKDGVVKAEYVVGTAPSKSATTDDFLIGGKIGDVARKYYCFLACPHELTNAEVDEWFKHPYGSGDNPLLIPS